MSKIRKPAESVSSVPRDIKVSLLVAAVSTTLRIIIPVFVLFFAGLVIDALRQQTAFFAVIGAILGFVVAAFLIFLQMKQLAKNGQDKLINDKSNKVAGDQKTVKASKVKETK